MTFSLVARAGADSIKGIQATKRDGFAAGLPLPEITCFGRRWISGTGVCRRYGRRSGSGEELPQEGDLSQSCHPPVLDRRSELLLAILAVTPEVPVDAPRELWSFRFLGRRFATRQSAWLPRTAISGCKSNRGGRRPEDG